MIWISQASPLKMKLQRSVSYLLTSVRTTLAKSAKGEEDGNYALVPARSALAESAKGEAG